MKAYHIETIICPECSEVQEAVVKHTTIWNIYIHECTYCNHIIMESEWNNKPKTLTE